MKDFGLFRSRGCASFRPWSKSFRFRPGQREYELRPSSRSFRPGRGAWVVTGSNSQTGRGGHRLQSEVEELLVRASLRNQGYQTPIELGM